MDYRTTSATGLASRRGMSRSGKAAFAIAALAVSGGLAFWIADDLANWLRSPQGSGGGRTFSFDDRFGAGSARNGPSIRYPSRPAARRDFDTEFGHIES